MDSIFAVSVIDQMEQNAKKPAKPVEDTSINQLPDNIGDDELSQLINELSKKAGDIDVSNVEKNFVT